MTTAAWATTAVGIASIAAVIVTAIWSKRPVSSNGKVYDKMFDLLKNDLLEVLKGLADLQKTNGNTLTNVYNETTKIHQNTTKWSIHEGEIVKDIGMMDRSVNEKLAAQNQTLIKIHERLDDIIAK